MLDDKILEVANRLAEPFHPKRVHWRIGSTNAKKLGVKPWEATQGMPLCYIDARDVMERLDGVVGPANWRDSYEETNSGRIICCISIKYGDEWITKSDGAGDTGTEGEKGAISDAFKRAGVKHGIGRYLYSINSGWIDLVNGKIPRAWLDHEAPKLLPTFKPSLWTDWRNFTDALLEDGESINRIKQLLGEEDYETAQAEWLAISNDVKTALKRPWTRGGVFDPTETKQMNYWNNDWKKPEKSA
jgi:hypothetical protein